MSTFINIIWALLSTFVFPTFISDNTLYFSNSIFSIFLFWVLYEILKKGKKEEKERRIKIYTHILGLIFAVMISVGHALDEYGYVSFKNLAVSIVLYSHVFARLLVIFWNYLMKCEEIMSNFKSCNKIIVAMEKAVKWFVEHPYMMTIVLLLCWLPCFIADFPGGYRYDATGELEQLVSGYNGNYPLLHSVIITRLLPVLYNLTGSYNVGIATYVIIQMVLVACIYTHIIYTFGKRNVNKLLLLVCFLYCAFFPIIQILVVQVVRDVLFGALLVYTMFLFYLMLSDKDSFLNSTGKPILLGVIFVLALLARNNNAGTVVFVIIIAVSAVVWLTNFKKYFRGSTIFALTCITCYILSSTILTSLCQPLMPAQIGSSLSLMSQSITRAYLYENEKWTDEEIAELSQFMYLDGIGYCAENADQTKNSLCIQDNFGAFFKFWFKIGLEHPGCYIDAILANTQNMWYPDSIIDGYNQVFTEVGQPYYGYDKCYYYISLYIEEPGVHMDYLPSLLNYYSKIGLYISFEKIPIVSMFFSIGFQFWIILNCLFYVMYRKINTLILPIAIILGYMIISACAPLVLLRYFAAAFFAVPMLIVFTLQPKH